MLYSVDRLEGCMAVLIDEEGNSRSVPLTVLPAEIQPGTMLRDICEGFSLATDEEAKRRRRVLELQRRLRKQ